MKVGEIEANVNDCTSEGARAPFAISIRVRQIHGSWSCNAGSRRSAYLPLVVSDASGRCKQRPSTPLIVIVLELVLVLVFLIEDDDEFEDDYD
jgi:hypothetical protein